MAAFTVEQLWLDFDEGVVSDDFDAEERAFIKMSFYAGAGAMLASLTRQAVDGEEIQVDHLLLELNTFMVKPR
jgi:hypothetical protein